MSAVLKPELCSILEQWEPLKIVKQTLKFKREFFFLKKEKIAVGQRVCQSEKSGRSHEVKS